MKGRALTCLLIVILALGAFTALSVRLEAISNTPEPEAELLFGEAEDFAPFVFTQRAAVSGHLVSGFTDDLATGGLDAGTRWSLAETSVGPVNEPELAPMLPGVDLNLSWRRGDEPPVPERFRGLYDSLAAEAEEAGGRADTSVPMSDFFEVMPLLFSGEGGAHDVDGDKYCINSGEAFGFELRGTEKLDAVVTVTSTQISFSVTAGPRSGGCRYSCSAAFAGGDIYMLLTSYGSDFGELTRMPGGSLGLFRVPCEPDGEGGVTVDIASAENIFPMDGEEYDDADVAPGADGESLLLVTAKDGNLELHVFSLPGGGLVQTLSLPCLGEARYVSSIAPDYGGVVLRSGCVVVGARLDAGRYTALQPARLDALPAEDWDGFAAAVEGSRVAVLQRSHLNRNLLRAAVCEDGEWLGCMLIEAPFADRAGMESIEDVEVLR